MQSTLTIVTLLLTARISVGFFSSPYSRVSLASARNAIQRDGQGYEIKSKDWFNGLSVDPGASLTDPRAVPPVAKEFAEKIKGGAEVTLKETLKLIDDNYEYFAVPFTNGNLHHHGYRGHKFMHYYIDM